MAFEEAIATKEEIKRFRLDKLWDKYNEEYCINTSEDSHFEINCIVDRDKDIWFCHLGLERVWSKEYDAFASTNEVRYMLFYNNKQYIVRVNDPKQDGFYDKKNDFRYKVWELNSIEPEIKESDEYKKVVEIIKKFLVFKINKHRHSSRYTISFKF